MAFGQGSVPILSPCVIVSGVRGGDFLVHVDHFQDAFADDLLELDYLFSLVGYAAQGTHQSAAQVIYSQYLQHLYDAYSSISASSRQVV